VYLGLVWGQLINLRSPPLDLPVDPVKVVIEVGDQTGSTIACQDVDRYALQRVVGQPNFAVGRDREWLPGTLEDALTAN
jgi:hypothetical protein